jgi:SAM-dependent methyltransferase
MGAEGQIGETVGPMACSCCAFPETAERQFTQQKAAAEMSRYRQKGPGPTTRLLRDGLAEAGLLEGTLLDVGGGVGALAFELLDRGVARAVVVDASSAYLAVASAEAVRRGRSPLTEFVHGDFISVSDQLTSAAVVTLDRVVCCYPFYEPLIDQALQHAERGFALSYPRNCWHVRIGVWFENARRQWRGNPFRMFVHSPSLMEALVKRAGFEVVSRHRTLMWSADVFRKKAV